MLQGAQTIIDFGVASVGLRLAILSDTHGYLDHRILAVAAHCDAVIHAGDVCGGSILTTLEKSSPRVYAVTGNNDAATRWSNPETGSDILPSAYELTLPGGLLVVEHGDRFGNHPSHEDFQRSWPEARAIVYGHTHRQVVDQSSDPWVMNPGAAGQTRIGDGPSCLVLSISQTGDWSVESMRFDIENSRAA